MRTVNLMKLSHERMIPFEKNDMTRRMSCRNERKELADRNEPFLVGKGTTATLV